MFNAFRLKNNYLLRFDKIDKTVNFDEIIWIDITSSNNDNNECLLIQKVLKEYQVSFLELKDIRKKNIRFFQDGNIVYIRSFFFFSGSKETINEIVVSFIIFNNRLYTISIGNSSIFYEIYQKYLCYSLLEDGNVYELLLNLFEIKLESLSDRVEYLYDSLKSLNFLIMSKKKIEEYDHLISLLNTLDKINWKIHFYLLDTQRTIRFLSCKVSLPLFQQKCAEEILNNIKLLLSYNECISNKINFLIQVAMKFIDIEQNRIIRTFSIVFLPPTLIASSYGMNFEFMPELQWVFGYPSAIILMVLSGLVPYLYFKHKNWL